VPGDVANALASNDLGGLCHTTEHRFHSFPRHVVACMLDATKRDNFESSVLVGPIDFLESCSREKVPGDGATHASDVGMAPKEHAGDEKEKKHVNPKEQALLADAARRELAALTMIEAAIVTWLAADAGRNLKIKAEAEVAEAKLKVEKEETQTRSAIALEKIATAAADESREKVVSSKAAAIAAQEYAYEIAHSTDEAAALLQEAKADIKKSMLEVTIAEKALANAVERLRASSTDFKWAKREYERAEGLAADSKLAESAAAGARAAPLLRLSLSGGAGRG